MYKEKTKFAKIFDKFGVYFTLVALIIVITILSPRFFTLSNALNILRQCSVYLLLSFGVTFVFISGGIDLSVGNILNFSTCVVAVLMVNAGVPMVLAVLLTIIIGIAVGALNGFCVSVLRVPPFLTTLGTMYIFKGFAQLMTHDSSISGLPESFYIFADTTFGIPNQILIALAVFVVLFIVMNHTRLGRHVFAIGSNEQAAKLSGINVTKIRFITYMISSGCAAIAGIVMASRLKLANATITSGYEMDSIAAVCIGGTSIGGGRGSLVKTVAGSLTLSCLRTGLNILGLSSSMQSVVIGFVIIIVVAIDMRNQVVQK